MDKWFAISLNHKLFSILLFLILYVKAPQIGNVFFVLIMKTQATRDALFVGLLIALLAVKKGKKNWRITSVLTFTILHVPHT